MTHSSVQTISDYLSWQKAIHGGVSTEELHRALVREGRAKPTLGEALAAVAVLGDLLALAGDTIERLADQQAMPDDFYRGPLARLRGEDS